MIPLHLKLKGFLSYLDPVDLDFTSFDLACISGSNGAGKSSLLDAMTWALFGQARKLDDSLINTRAEGQAAEVVFEFAYEDNTYCIQRSKTRDKPVRLEFFILLEEASASAARPENQKKDWKPLTEKTVRETEKRIRDTLRLDYETFINASFFLQGKADQFAQQRPGDRKRILSSILGLDAWEVYKARAADQRKAAEEDVASLDGQLREINAELAEEPARITRLKELEKDLARLSSERKTQSSAVESLRRLAAALAEQKKLVETLERGYANEKVKLDRLAELAAARAKERQEYQDQLSRAAEIEAAYQGWQAARADLEHWEGIAAQFREQQGKRQAPLLEIEAERGRLAQEQRTLAAQSQAVEAVQLEIPALKNGLERAQQALSQAAAQLERRAALEGEIRLHHQAQADAKAENPRLKTEMDELKARIDDLETTEDSQCPLCGQPLSADHRLSLLADLNSQGKQLGERYRQNQALLRDFEIRLKGMEKELASLSQAENELRQQNRAADQTLERIRQINQVYADWQNTGEPRLQTLTRQLRENDFAREAQATLAAIDAGLKSIGYDPQAHEASRQLELTGRAADAGVRQLEAARAALAPLERELAGLEKQVGEQESEVARQKAAYEEAAAGLAEAASNLPDLNQAEDNLLRMQEQENRLRMDVGAARQKVDVLDRLRTRQASLNGEREEKTRLIGRLKTLERAFGKDGVPALLIEQALPEIEGQANLILDRLSGGAMAVRFATQKDFKDKNRDDKKETLDILISDGAGTRDYDMFSGGEAFRVNFAIRLALSRVLAQRAGARLQTLVIDEGFGSQDALGRQRLIEAINLVHKDFAKILVITHLEELKEAFPCRIEVEKTPRGSSISVIQ
jgi:DNA repair protein SbcC/Rad50